MSYELHHGDCLEVMKSLPDNSVDAVVTDPPYGLSFMGKRWDYDVPSVEIWQEVLRVLKPGGHLLSFGGTRTYHRMVVNIEDAGFEIRDQIQWIYGSGFPKSLDVSKAIDKMNGDERPVIGTKKVVPGVAFEQSTPYETGRSEISITSAASAAWEGWGTALKPANEPIVLARKPLEKGLTVAQNVLKWGTGAININDSRVEGEPWRRDSRGREGYLYQASDFRMRDIDKESHSAGRFPANVIHDGSEEVLACFPLTGQSNDRPRNNGEFKSVAKGRDLPHVAYGHADGGGSVARFFYSPKASKHDREAGLPEAGLPEVGRLTLGNYPEDPGKSGSPRARNHHPTVKPTELMRYLCRLITPPNGTALDPFAGSGSTGKAAILEGFSFIGIEREKEYAEIARARIAHVSGGLFV